MSDPVYVPIDNDGYTNLNPETDFQSRILEVCHRKYFRGAEKRRTKNIEKHLVEHVRQEIKTAQYPRDFVEEMILWADKKNSTSGTIYPVITVPALLNAIQNNDNIGKWLSKHKENIEVNYNDHSESTPGGNILTY